MLPDLSFDLMARDLTKKAFASVDASTEKTKSKLGGLKTAFSGVGTAVKGIASGGALLGGLGIARGVQESLALWNEQALAVAKVEQAVKSTGGAAGLSSGQLQKMASSLQEISTFGDENILANVTTPLLTFTNVAGPEFERAQGLILDMSTVLKTDLLSATTQVGKALNDPLKGITALGRAGVQFTETQKTMIKEMVAVGDTAGAQKVMLDELAKQFGGQAAAAAKTGLGPLQQLSNAWGDFKEEIGAGAAQLLPPVTSALSGLIRAFTAMPQPVKTAVGVVAALTAVILPVAGAVGLAVTAFGALAPLLPIVGASLAALTGPVGLVVAAVGALGVVVYENWDSIKTAASGIAATFIELKDKAITAVSSLVSGVTDWLSTRLSAAWSAVTSKIEAVGNAFAWLYDSTVGHSWIPDMVDEIGMHMDRLDENMVKPATSAVEQTGTAFDGLAGDIKSGLKSIFSDGKVTFGEFADLGVSLMQKMTDRIMDQALDPLADALSTLFSGGNVSGTGGGGLLGAIGTGLGTILGGLFGGFFEKGGTLAPGKIGVVGEAGPEIVRAGAAPLRISPVDAQAATMRGGDVIYAPVYHMDNRGADASAIARLEAGLRERDRTEAKRVQKYNWSRDTRMVRA